MGIPSNTAASPDMVAAKIAPLRIWHCSHPRTASNVLAKQFRDHPKLAPKEYTFMTAFLYGPERLDEQGGDKKPPDADKATFQNCFDELQDFMASAEQQVRRLSPGYPLSHALAERWLAVDVSNARPTRRTAFAWVIN